MVKVTKTAAIVMHGHAKKPGSATDKAPGSTIKRYPFAKYGRAEAIKKAHLQHYAIVKSEERASKHMAPAEASVAVPASTVNVKQYAVDTPELGSIPSSVPSDDAQSAKYLPDSTLLIATEIADLNNIPYGSAAYSESLSGHPLMDELKKIVISRFEKEPPTDDTVVHGWADELGIMPDLMENAVYEVLKDFLAEGESSGEDVEADPEQVMMGLDIEEEHTTNSDIAMKIVRDHLTEDPLYYTKLKAANLMEHTEIVQANEIPIDHRIASETAIGIGIKKDETQQTPSAGITEQIVARDKPVYNGEGDDDEDDMWVDAFKSGEHTDSEGVTRTWDPGTLVNIAQQYNRMADSKNPNRKMAPVVLGHPKDDAPAYGWVEKVKVVGDKLKAKLTELNEGFVEALKSGAYKTRSISLYPDLNIRHLGFLGAIQPAVPGLAPFKFAESAEKVTTIEFEEETPMAFQEEITSLKRENSFFKKLFNLFKIDINQAVDHASPDENTLSLRVPESRGVVPSYDKKGESTMADIANAPAQDTVAGLVASPDNVVAPGQASKEVPIADQKADKDELTKMSAELDSLKQEFARVKQERDAFEKELGSKEVRDRTQNHREFCEKLVTTGQLRPVDVDQHVLNLELRYKADSETADFSEKKETPSLTSYMEYLQTLPTSVCFEEIAKPVTAGNIEHAGPVEKVMKYCDEYMKQDPKMSYSAALEKCGEEHNADMQEYLANI